MDLIHVQTICSARVFLNIFGFILGTGEVLKKGDSLKIYDKSNNPVGNFWLDNIAEEEKAFINVISNGNTLSASYEVPSPSSIIIPDASYERGSWSCCISFEFTDANGQKTDGEISIECDANSYGELESVCHSELKFLNNENKEISIRIFNNCFIVITISDENYRETININDTYSEYRGFRTLHQINRNGTSQIIKVTEPIDNSCKVLIVGESTGNEGEITPTIAVKVNKRYEDYEEASIIEDLDLMKYQGEDQKMFDRIRTICDSIKCGDISIIENIVNVSFDLFSDDLVKCIFGFERDRSLYQDGSTNLTEACFGPKVDCFDDPKQIHKAIEGE